MQALLPKPPLHLLSPMNIFMMLQFALRSTWIMSTMYGFISSYCLYVLDHSNITFLNKAGVTLSCRGNKKIPAPHTWESLEFNLDVGSITLCLVLQLFMLELGVCKLQHGSDRWGPIESAMHSTFLFFIFLVCCMLGGQGTLLVLVKNVMNNACRIHRVHNLRFSMIYIVYDKKWCSVL